MDLDDLLYRYFGARELAEVPPAALSAGIERMQVDLGMATDRGQRFALWCLLHMLGGAPELGVAFNDAADREVARKFMDMLATAGEG
jgi:hypothetical protein